MARQAKNSLETLRSRAEDLASAQASALAPTRLQDVSHEAMRRMLHELQVHQIELEMQNEQLRNTQGELDAARARYFDLYDLAPVGYCTVSESGLILETNFTAATMLEMVRSDLVHQPVSRLIVKSDQDTYYKCRKALMETGMPQECELQMRRRSEATLWVHLRMICAQDGTVGQVQRMVLSDITERKRLDHVLLEKTHELERSRAVADKASQAKSDFLSNMSHELRSPLNAILGFAQILKIAKPAPTPAQTDSIHQILRAGWYLLDLIGEILDLSAIESGQLKLAIEPVTVSQALQHSRTGIEAAARTAGIALHFGQVNATLQVNADRHRLQQVMGHLLSNAITYNRSGGSVEVICSVEPGQRLRICIRDTGYGLSDDKIAHLFQPFNRLGRETTAEEGTGVGLALSKRLVESMGGSIGAHSAVGAGSDFWIELKLFDTTFTGEKP